MPVRTMTVLVGTLLAAGCAMRVPPPPEQALPAQWRAGTPPPGAEVEAQWWRAFGSEQLEQLIAQARGGNQDLAAATARLAQARAAARVAGAGRYPTLDASVGGTRSNRSGGGAGSSGGEGDPSGGAGGRSGGGFSNRYDVSLTLGYEVDFWGRQAAAARAGAARVQARAHDADVTLLGIQAGVASSYFAVLAARQREALGRARLEHVQRQSELVEARVRLGAASGVELAAQQQILAAAQAAQAALLQDVLVQEAGLALLLGLAPAALPTVSGSLDALTAPAVTPSLPATVLARRPDIASARAELAAAQGDLAEAQAALLPGFSLSASTGLASATLGGLTDGGAAFQSLGAQLLAPLFRGGALRGARDQRRGQLDEQAALYRSALLIALRETEDALTGASQARSAYAAQTSVLAAAADAARLARARHQAGAIDASALLDAERSLLDAREGQLQAHQAQLNAAVTLYRVLGGGWTPPVNSGAPAPAPAAVL